MPHNSRNNQLKSPNSYKKHTHIRPKEELLEVQANKWNALLKEAFLSRKTVFENNKDEKDNSKALNKVVDNGRENVCRILRKDEKRERIRRILSKDKNLERRSIV